VEQKDKKLIAHCTKGSVLDELDISEHERLELKLKADLHQDILKLIRKKKFTSRQLERTFDTPQPRVSELLRGKLSLLSISKLLYYAHLLGAHAVVKLKTSCGSSSLCHNPHPGQSRRGMRLPAERIFL